jgi:hypothetical protein
VPMPVPAPAPHLLPMRLFPLSGEHKVPANSVGFRRAAMANPATEAADPRQVFIGTWPLAGDKHPLGSFAPAFLPFLLREIELPNPNVSYLLLCLRFAPPRSRLPANQRSLKSIGPIPPPATTACRGLGLLPAQLCLGPSRVEARSICRLPARLHQGPGRMPGQPFSPPLHVCTFPCRLPATSRLLRSYLPRLGSSHSQPSLSDQLIGR